MQDKDKQYDPARNNEQSPAPGFASVNTHSQESEEMEKEIPADQRRSDPQETELAGFTNPKVPLEPNDVDSDTKEE
jgi:hypothetical protein